jgi:hypothetical protein
MTPRDFCFWLQGHLSTGNIATPIVKEKLSTVDMAIPPVFPSFPTPFIPASDVYKICSKCGISLSGIMGYSCPHIGCPTGLGPLT